MRSCEEIVLLCRNRRIYPPMRPLRKGERILGCDVIECVPEECVPRASTRVVFVSRLWRRRELSSNVVFESEDEFVVLPKRVVEALEKLIKDIKKGRAPGSGVLLLGPPGTGKSMIVRVLAEYYHLPLIYAGPDSILSRYLGDSEKNMRAVFERAKRSEPSILFFDECDWFALSRKLGSGEETGRAIRNVLTVFFVEMQRLVNERRRVLVIAATNYKEDALDEAVKREGRLGIKIFVPPPDEEAVRYAMERIVGRIDEGWVLRLVSAAEGMANIRRYLRELREGRKPRLGSGGRGYRRLFHPDPVETRYIHKALPANGFSRVWIHGSYSVLRAIVANAFTLKRKPVLEIYDPSAVFEGINVAEQAGLPILIPCDLYPEAQKLLDRSFRGSVVIAGQEAPKIEAALIARLDDIVRIEGLETVSRIVGAFYGRSEEEEVKKVKKCEDLERLALGALV